MTLVRAFGYVQVDGKSQVEIDDLKRQERIIRDYAASNGIILEQIYSEKCSAVSLDNRLALAKMLISLDLNEQEIKMVVIDCLERLSCEYILQEVIVQDLRNRGYGLISVKECAELRCDEPERTLVRKTVDIVTIYHKKMYELKMQAWREFIHHVERNRTGSGTIKAVQKRKSCVVSPEIAREIKKMRSKMPGHRQLSCQEIADIMNNLGHTTVNGRPFDSHIVRNVLKKPQRAS